MPVLEIRVFARVPDEREEDYVNSATRSAQQQIRAVEGSLQPSLFGVAACE